MSGRTETRLLCSVFILFLILLVASWLNKDTWFDWEYLQSDIKLMLALIWLTFILSLVGLIAIFLVGLLKFRREKTRITLLFLTNFFLFVCLLLEIGNYIEFHGGEHCFPYNITTEISYQPPFLPLLLTIDTMGNISLSGDTSLQFELGTITVVTDVNRLPAPDNTDNTDNSVTILIIRHHQGNNIVDSQYLLHSSMDSVRIVTTGTTVTQIMKNYYFIDASQGELGSTQVNIFPANSVCTASVSS